AGRYPGPGNYIECCWTAMGTDQFRPGDIANSNVGSVGALEEAKEARVKTLCVGEKDDKKAVDTLKRSADLTGYPESTHMRSLHMKYIEEAALLSD
ncbi:MAG: hypothetical protein Q9167_007996, partial [Letrouitia subvulpina]